MLSQNPDNLLLGEPLALHRPSPFVGPDSNSAWRKYSVAGHSMKKYDWQNSKRSKPVYLWSVVHNESF
jgi:hypothetical protein